MIKGPAQNILISIKPKYVNSILSGEKTVEIRRGSIGFDIGTVLWIYSTLPSGRVELHATVAGIECNSASTIWRKYRKQTSLTKSDYYAYVEGCKKVSAIRLTAVKALHRAPQLDVLRAEKKGFHPPQSFIRLALDCPLFELLRRLEPRQVVEA